MREISRTSLHRRLQSAFAIKELVAVIVCLTLLGLTQLPVLGIGKSSGRLAQCMSNFQQLGRAWSMYSQDNSGKVVWNPEGGDAGKVATKPSWAGGWIDFSSSTDNTNVALLTSYNPPSSYGGLLGPYLSSAAIFHCPEDFSTAQFPGRRLARVRSVSMNTYMGGRQTSGALNSWNRSPFRTISSINDFTRLKPSATFVFIEEREQSINDPVFATHLPFMLDANDDPIPSGAWIVDYPADWHDGGATLAFADGHSERWRWKDSRTTPARVSGQTLLNNIPSADNPDMLRLAKATSSH